MPLLATQRIDQAVADVFTLMLGVPCASAPCAVADHTSMTPERLTAIVGFTGCVLGKCAITVSRRTAELLTGHMLGVEPHTMPADEQRIILADAVGELCNMIAGGWKSRLDASYACCALTPPQIMTAPPRAALPPDTHLARCYLLFDECLTVDFVFHSGSKA